MKHILLVSMTVLSVHSMCLGQVIVSFPLSFLSDFVQSPMELHDAPISELDGAGNPVIANVPFQLVQWNLATAGIEFRQNIVELNANSCLALTAGANLGLGTFTESWGSDTSATVGIDVSIQTPLMLRWYRGNLSTDHTDDKFGFNFGVGVEFNKIGLTNNEHAYPNNAFVTPCASMGLIYRRQKDGKEVLREFNVKVGMGPGQATRVDGQGLPIEGKREVNARAVTVKLSIAPFPVESYEGDDFSRFRFR